MQIMISADGLSLEVQLNESDLVRIKQTYELSPVEWARKVLMEDLAFIASLVDGPPLPTAE